MKVGIDLGRCAGFGNCVDAAPEIFEMSMTADIAEVLHENPPADLHDSVRKAARVCPADAVLIEE